MPVLVKTGIFARDKLGRNSMSFRDRAYIFLWNVWEPWRVSEYNISMYTHQAHHLSNCCLLKYENYKKNVKIRASKCKSKGHVQNVRFEHAFIFE